MGQTHYQQLVSGGIALPAFLMPQMSGAKNFYVDPTSTIGNDGNRGTDPKRPLRTLAAAYAKCVSGRGDRVYLQGGPDSAGSTGHTARLSATLTWAKHNTHLIGVGAPAYNRRSRITGEATGATFTPLIDLTASGCVFANFSLFHDATTTPIALNITGDRNYLWGVDALGIGASGGDDADAASIKLNDADENVFERCIIGLDTVARDQVNANLVVTGGSQRNRFTECFFPMFADGANARFVLMANAADIDRWILFERCFFHNAIKSTGTQVDSVFTVHASVGGTIIIRDSHFIGAAEWDSADTGNVFVDNVNGATTSGKSLAETM